MSQINASSDNKPSLWVWGAAGLAAAVLALLATVLVGALAGTPVGDGIMQTLNSLFGTDTTHATWYMTRSAGIIAYLLLWFSTAWGLAVSSKITDKVLHRAFTFDFHEFISLLSIGFTALHIVVLTGDKFMPYSVAQILIPFISPYRPVWVGVGVIAFYLMLLVTVTFYIRSRISMKTFRVIHYASFAGFLGAAVHGLLSGTDTPLAMTQLMYVGTFLVIVFLTAYWLFTLGAQKQRPDARSKMPDAGSQKLAVGVRRQEPGREVRPAQASPYIRPAQGSRPVQPGQTGAVNRPLQGTRPGQPGQTKPSYKKPGS